MVYDVELIDIVKQFVSKGHTVNAVDHIDLQIEQGEFLALLGPSGCGKTTTLRMIAGFEQPTSGKILIRGTAMQDIPPFHRPVNTVFQDYALFPHMTILQNVMFGLKMEGVDGKQAKKQAEEALEQVQLPNVGHRRPSQLSGGQQQRVALARALVKRPAVLLLDEPLGALDLKLRKEMQYELKSMQHEIGITFIFVTHDQEEAMVMANRIAVLNHGKILQLGTAREVYEKPATRFVADFIGETNFINGIMENKEASTGYVRLADDTVIAAFVTEENAHAPDHKVSIAVRPERISLIAPDAPSPSNGADKFVSLIGQVRQVHYIGTDTRYDIDIAGNNKVSVRVQNVDYPPQAVFDIGDKVKVFWTEQSGTVLDH